MIVKQEARRSFRVMESVYLKFEEISDSEFNEGLDRRRLRLGTSQGAQSMLVEIESRLGEAMFLLNKESEQVGRCLTLLNDKLNVVLNQLPELRENRSALAKLPPQTCEVSADGLVFASATPLSPGTKLHLRLLLSSDNSYVETFCEVSRQLDPLSDDNPGLPYGVAVEFHGMKAEQRETLIQHMFNLESETLRMRRLKLEEFET